MTVFPAVRIAAVQAPPVILDAEASIAKAVVLLGDVAEAGARLAVLPETFVSLYPSNAWAAVAAGTRADLGPMTRAIPPTTSATPSASSTQPHAATWSATTRSASATTRCDDEPFDVPAVIQCRPAECHVTGRPDGRDRESRPVGESPRWP